jgi:predicted 3-demethylubiquinone-9 3-methyltransferase (glyoxalase superfamily)
MQKVSPFLWFDTQAEEAATFYVSLFDNSAITGVTRQGGDGGDLEGNAMSVSFTLDGVVFHALNAGPVFSFNEAVSFLIAAETQEEIDRLWDALTADGGEPSRCGWLKDRFGLSWQVVPPVLQELLSDPDPERAGRVMTAMLAMDKIIVADLHAAAAEPRPGSVE